MIAAMTSPPGTDPAELLDADQAETLARIAALTRDFDAIVAGSADSATDDEHDPEGATIAFERAQVSALLAAARAHLAETDQAIERLGDGTYGGCERCGRPIAAERLLARPTARRCVACVAAR